MMIDSTYASTSTQSSALLTDSIFAFKSSSDSSTDSSLSEDVTINFSVDSEQNSEAYSKLFQEYIATSDSQATVDLSTPLIQSYGKTTSEVLNLFRTNTQKGSLVSSRY